jgi:parallel beta-helix repeat protein
MAARGRTVRLVLTTVLAVACTDQAAGPDARFAPSFHRDDGDGRRTVLVDPSGRKGAAKTIQEGVNLAPAGGRVRVMPGTYHEQVTVSKNDLRIVAQDGHGNVVVDAHGHDFGFLVLNASGATIEGFRIEHAHEADIFLNGATFTTIRENVTTAAGHDGIEVVASNDNVIEHNVAVDNLAPNACGVNLTGGSKRNIVRDNLLVNNEWGIQIAGATTLDNVITGNRSLRNRGNGIRNVADASGTIIEENRSLGNGFAPSTLTGATAAGIRIGGGLGIVVRFNDLERNAQAGLRVGPTITTPIDASCNWWGSASGPMASAWPSGTGDAVVVEAGGATPAFTPFARSPNMRYREHDGDADVERGEHARCGSTWSAPVNLGPVINTDSSDMSPSLSPDELSLYFTTTRPGGQGAADIWVSRRTSPGTPWQAPVNLGPTINSPSGDGGPTLSADGHQLFFFSTRPVGQGLNDLYVSYRADTHDNFAWGAPVNLGPQVNTAANEAGPEFVDAAVSGTATLLFNRGQTAVSTAPSDLMTVSVGADGLPTAAPTFIVELNTPANDFGPELSDDGLELFFVSGRPGTLGGNDLWRTTRATVLSAWAPAENLGAVVNTALNDRHPSLSASGRTLIFASTRSGGLGSDDLWMSTRSGGRSGDRHDGRRHR